MQPLSPNRKKPPVGPAAIVVVSFLALCGGCGLLVALLPHGAKPKPYSADCSQQAERQATIEWMTSQQIISEVRQRDSDTWELWVRDLFVQHELKRKNTMAAIVFGHCWCQNQKAEKLVIVDSRTGKEIGRYHPGYGVEMD